MCVFEKLGNVSDNAAYMTPDIVRCLILGSALLLGLAACTPATGTGAAATATSGSARDALAPMATPASPDTSAGRPSTTAGANSAGIEDGGQAAPAGSIDLRELPPSSDSAAAADVVEMPAPGAPDPLARAVQLAREDLGARLHSLRLQPENIEEIALVGVEQIVWGDRSLGCPKPNTDYLAEEVPGFKLVLKAGAESYTYHTDMGQNVVLCQDGKPAPPLE